MKKLFQYLLLLLILTVPTYSLMLRPGIFTMHDFHVFRQFEFDKCIQAHIFPCRWAADAGKGYGEPLFNFYGQFPYWLGEVAHLLGFSILDSTKLLLIFSVILSGVSMFFLGRKFWGNVGGLISAFFYIYAPYRAVDIWVRGALNESLAFVLFPFIFYHLDELTQRYRHSNLILLILGVSALITTHNLSVMMFAPFMALWWLFRTIKNRSFKSLPSLIMAAVFALLVSAYYLLPVALESKYITISHTTRGYYDFRAHFVTLNQLFVSNFWGYGGSTWGPNDTMSFSVGYLHWIIPIVIALFMLIRRKINFHFLVFSAFGLVAIILTHNKSAFIWTHLPFMAYIQFPWRFLTLSTLFLSLASGAATLVLSKKVLIILISLVILFNFNFFHPDIWRSISDKEQFSGSLWDEERSSALQDFWPIFGANEPDNFASQKAQIMHTTKYARIKYPIVYFPGWIATVDGQRTPIYPSQNLGLITLRVPLDYSRVSLRFVDTWPRTLGNSISLISLGGLLLWYFSKKRLYS